MRTIFIALMLLATLTVVIAQPMPSDRITHISPPSVLDLQHVSPGSALAISAMNAPLTAWKDRPLVDLGHYFVGTRAVIQVMDETVSPTLLNFSKQTPAIPASILNATTTEAEA